MVQLSARRGRWSATTDFIPRHEYIDILFIIQFDWFIFCLHLTDRKLMVLKKKYKLSLNIIKNWYNVNVFFKSFFNNALFSKANTNFSNVFMVKGMSFPMQRMYERVPHPWSSKDAQREINVWIYTTRFVQEYPRRYKCRILNDLIRISLWFWKVLKYYLYLLCFTFFKNNMHFCWFYIYFYFYIILVILIICTGLTLLILWIYINLLFIWYI